MYGAPHVDNQDCTAVCPKGLVIVNSSHQLLWFTLGMPKKKKRRIYLLSNRAGNERQERRLEDRATPARQAFYRK